MKKKSKIKKAERLELSILLEKGYGVRDIARALKRSPGTISEEIKRNSSGGVYDPHKAQQKVYLRRSNAKKDWKKIEKDGRLRNYITDKLKEGWNPDEISGRMKHEKQPFYASKTAIYEWLRSSRGAYYCKYLYSKRYYVKRRVGKKEQRVMIPNRVAIQERTAGAYNRSRYGHWETDAVVSGKRGSGSLSVSKERKSRLVKIKKCESMSSTEHILAHKEVAETHRMLSVAFDNGIENKHHEQLNARGVRTYFCDPYSSWQKGAVENANKLIRRYVPKGANISRLSVEYVQKVEDRLNNKPRKILGYRTSLEIAADAGIILSKCSD